MIWLKNLIYKLIDFGDKLFENNKYYHWYVSSKICSRGTRKGLEDFWYHRTEPKDATAIRQYDSCVISIFDGGLDRGGAGRSPERNHICLFYCERKRPAI